MTDPTRRSLDEIVDERLTPPVPAAGEDQAKTEPSETPKDEELTYPGY